MSNQELRPNPEQIAVRAYELFLSRGCEPGRDLDDWLMAENQLVLEMAAQEEASPIPNPKQAGSRTRGVKAGASVT